MAGSKPKLTFNLERDVEVLAAMAANLTPYLYENEIYGAMPGDLPRLTLGGLLLRLHRLTALETILSPNQQHTVQDARLNFEAEVTKWAVHYEKKLQAELSSRLAALSQFLSECQENRANCVAGYPVQAEKRTMIEHLKAAAQENDVFGDDLAARLVHVDQQIRRVVESDEFIFSDPRLLPAYPADTFWWLYSHIADR